MGSRFRRIPLDAALFGAGGVASALTMHPASQRASLLPSAKNPWRRGHRDFFRSLLDWTDAISYR